MKVELNSLHEKLFNYIDKNRNLETENNKIKKEIDEYREKEDFNLDPGILKQLIINYITKKNKRDNLNVLASFIVFIYFINRE